MTDSTDSMGGFLALDEAGKERLKKRIAQVGCLVELGAALGRGLPEGAPGAAAAQIAERLAELLETPISQVLAAAWSRDPALAGYSDAQRHPAGQIALVPLADHTVTSSHRPSVELLMESAPLGRVEFQVELAVTLKGAMIAVRDGRIMELRAGRTDAELTLACAETAIAERKGELKLPGVIRFGEGIPIVPPVKQAPELAAPMPPAV